MNMDIHSQAEELNKKHRRKRTWYKILFVPICLVVFVTTYALILPAITMESTPDTYCGIAEHVHTDDCYELPGTPAHKEIQCTAGANLGQGEYIIHKHDNLIRYIHRKLCWTHDWLIGKRRQIISVQSDIQYTHRRFCAFNAFNFLRQTFSNRNAPRTYTDKNNILDALVFLDNLV